MAGPWEQFQQEDGPWSQFQQSAPVTYTPPPLESLKTSTEAYDEAERARRAGDNAAAAALTRRAEDIGAEGNQIASFAATFGDLYRSVKQAPFVAAQLTPWGIANRALMPGVRDAGDKVYDDLKAEQAEADRVNEPLYRNNRTGQVGGYAAQVLGPGLLAKYAQGANAVRTGVQAVASPLVRAFLPETVRGAVLQGGTLGAAQPLATGEGEGTRAANAGLGGVVGGFGQALVPAVGATIRGTRSLLQPFTQEGRERIVGGLLQRFAADPSKIATPLADPVTGMAPTLAEATLDPGIAQLQRAAMTRSPEVANAVTTSRRAANQSRMGLLQGFLGSNGEREAIEAGVKQTERAAYDQLNTMAGVDPEPTVKLIDRIMAGPDGKVDAVAGGLRNLRGKFFEPYEDALRIKDARAAVVEAIGGRMSSADNAALLEARRLLANRGGLSPDEIVEQLSGLSATSRKASEAIARAKELVGSAPLAFENRVDRLLGVRSAIKEQLDSTTNDRAAAVLIDIRNSLDDQIRSVTGDTLDSALDARRIGMRPANEMDTMRELLARTTADVPNSSGGIDRGFNAGQFVKATDDFGFTSGADRAARSATGFRRASTDTTLGPAAQNALDDVRVGLLRQMDADTSGKVAGSPTAQFMAGQNIMESLAGPLGMKEGSWSRGILGPIIEGGAGRVYSAIGLEDRLQPLLAEVLTNPQRAQQILSRLPPRDRILIEQAAAPYIRGAALTGAATADN